MFPPTFKNVLVLRYSIRASNPQRIRFLQLNFLSTSPKPKYKPKDEGKRLFTMNYLITGFGISPDRAVSACKYIAFDNPERADSVVSFLHKQGFTKAQISLMVRQLPYVLSCDPEKTLLPKIEYFKSLGVSGTDIASMLSLAPNILQRSLEKHLIPAVGLLRDLFQSVEGMVSSLRTCGHLLCVDLKATCIRNIEYLKDLGVPETNIMPLLQKQPRTLSICHDKFREIVNDVKDKGFNPDKFLFVYAVHAFASMSKATLDKKMQIYRSWGFSDEEISEAFLKQPHFVIHSPSKIMDSMHYLIKKMGFRSSIVIERPQLLGLSLQKRIIPRCAIYQVLSDKGLITRKFKLARFLECPEKEFLRTYVLPFEAQVPEMLMLYKKNSPCLT